MHGPPTLLLCLKGCIVGARIPNLFPGCCPALGAGGDNGGGLLSFVLPVLLLFYFLNNWEKGNVWRCAVDVAPTRSGWSLPELCFVQE